jgi:hypothetical protein
LANDWKEEYCVYERYGQILCLNCHYLDPHLDGILAKKEYNDLLTQVSSIYGKKMDFKRNDTIQISLQTNNRIKTSSIGVEFFLYNFNSAK